MGIEHREKRENEDTKRCPSCGHVSVLKSGDCDYFDVQIEANGHYFYCQNPKCNVERIYSDDAVMVTGK